MYVASLPTIMLMWAMVVVMYHLICCIACLQFIGYDVRYCRNLTDIDDKILKKAQELFGNRMRYADITGSCY